MIFTINCWLQQNLIKLESLADAQCVIPLSNSLISMKKDILWFVVENLITHMYDIKK